MSQNAKFTVVNGKPGFSVKYPEINHVLTLSTVHLTEEDNKRLSDAGECGNYFSVYPFEYGFIIYVGESLEKGEFDQRTESMNAGGMSDSFIHIVNEARLRECNYIMFDVDGTVYDDLPQYDW